MIRKTILAVATAAVVGAAALAPTSALAWKGKHHHHGGWGFGGVVVVADDDCGWQWFTTRRGYLVKRYVCG